MELIFDKVEAMQKILEQIFGWWSAQKLETKNRTYHTTSIAQQFI